MARQKKMGAIATALTEKQAFGPEPTWQGVATQTDLIAYYNWCNYRLDLKVANAALVKYVNSQGQDGTSLNSLPEYMFTTVGFTARLLLNGGLIPADAMERFRAKIQTLLDRARDVSSVAPKRGPAQFVNDKMQEACIFADRLYDQVLVKKEVDEEIIQTLKNGIVTKKVAEHMLPTYKKEIEEMEFALSGKDQECTEGFSHMSRKELRELTNGVADFIKILEEIGTTNDPKVPKVRKIRARKPKSPDKQVAKLKFADKDDKYNIKSVDPRSIVNSAEVWLFNKEYRKITVLRAIDRGGLTVKGSTIYGFDETSSFSKKVRKPEELFPQILTGGKVSARKAFESLKTLQTVAKGRVGEDTLILRVFR